MQEQWNKNASTELLDQLASTVELNWYREDHNLTRWLSRFAPDVTKRFSDTFDKIGAWLPELDHQAAYSDRHAPPMLDAHYDADGVQRSGTARVNSSYESCHQAAYQFDLLRDPYIRKDGSHMPSFIGQYLISQADISVGCPYCMTAGVIFGLHRYSLPEQARTLIDRDYLPELMRTDGKTATGGTWVTEAPSGSDPGQTETVAVEDDKDSTWARLTGTKWFASNANGQIALAMARPEGAPKGIKGLGLYLVPSHLSDGNPNNYYLSRPYEGDEKRGLKDKMGTRGLPTGEISLNGAHAVRLAGPGEGMRMMMEVLSNSRIHNAVAAAGVTRRAVLEATSYAEQRMTWGKYLKDHPQMTRDLADLITRHEGTFALAFEAAKAFEAADSDNQYKPWMRLTTALAKYRTANHAIHAISQAKQVLGGNGYTADSSVERMLRDTHVLDVWEGPDNIQGLELMRLLAQHQEVTGQLFKRMRHSAANAPDILRKQAEMIVTLADDLETELSRAQKEDPAAIEPYAKDIMRRMADGLTGCLLLEESATDISQYQDIRKAIIAKRFCDSFVSGSNIPYDPNNPDPALAFRDVLLRYARISPASWPGTKAGPSSPTVR